MKWISIAILVMVVFAFSPAKSAEAAISFSIGFHDELSPYGSWMNYSNYGNVWRPYGNANFRPYVNGSWAYTNSGPTWYGNEPYAPYVYHYGSWVFSPQFGWVWVPGNEYHGGNVNWSYGGNYIAWRPAYPSGYNYGGYGAGYGGGYGAGYGGGFGSDFNMWVVIDADRFGYRDYSPYVYRSAYVQDLFQRRVFRQRYDTFRRDELERIVRRPVRVVDAREREVRIGDRRSRILVTPDEEVRIQKHVTQVRARRGNDDRNVVERDNVMKRKFEDIRSKSNSKDARRAGDDGRKQEVRKTEVRKTDVRKADVKSGAKVDKSKSKKVISSHEVQRKPDTKAIKSNQKKSNDKDFRSNTSSHKASSDNVKKASYSSRKPSSSSRKQSSVSKTSYSSRKPVKVESASRSVRKTEVKSNVKSGRNKAEISKSKKTTQKRQKPSKRS